jgi:hypothetical protein
LHLLSVPAIQAPMPRWALAIDHFDVQKVPLNQMIFTLAI